MPNPRIAIALLALATIIRIGRLVHRRCPYRMPRQWRTGTADPAFGTARLSLFRAMPAGAGNPLQPAPALPERPARSPRAGRFVFSESRT